MTNHPSLLYIRRGYMPAALVDIPWDQIRQDRLSGMSYDDLSAKYGVKAATIAQRSSRYGWKCSTIIARKEAKRAVANAVKAHVSQGLAELKPQLEQAAQEWIQGAREAASKVVKQVSSRLDASQEPEDLVKLANALDRADTVGRRALRLDAPEATNAGRPLVSMHFGEGSLSIVLGDTQAPLDSGPVIDVDSPDNSGLETT